MLFRSENRNGLIVNTEVFEANGTAERDAALVMLEQIPSTELEKPGLSRSLDGNDEITCGNSYSKLLREQGTRARTYRS